jgi:hypothetical protein
MITEEREQRATAMMIKEVTEKRFYLKLRECCEEPSSTERGRTGPLNRIVKAAKMRREPVFGLSVSKIRGGALFLKLVGRVYKISRVIRALKGAAARALF